MGRGLGSLSFKSPWFYTGWCWLGGGGSWAGRQGSPKTGLHQWHALPGIIVPISLELLYMKAEKMLEPVPEGDILIHAGDFTNYGRREEAEKFNTWLGTLPHRWWSWGWRWGTWRGTLPHSLFWWYQSNHHWTFYRHKIVIAGNHEITFDRASFDNIYAKKKVFGENYDPSDPKVRPWNITLP